MDRNDENDRTSHIPDSSSTKPMDSKRDVEQSPDEKIGQDFRGYVNYKDKEDILDQDTGLHQVDAKLEETETGVNASGVSHRFSTGQEQPQQGSVASGAEGGNDGLSSVDSTNSEIGVPQNVSNEDRNEDKELSGTDLDQEVSDAGR